MAGKNNKFKSFFISLWEHSAPFLECSLPVIFFHYVIYPFLHEPFQSTSLKLEEIFFTCTLSIYVATSILLVLKKSINKLKKSEFDDDYRNNGDEAPPAESPNKLAAPKTLNPMPVNLDKFDEIPKSEKTVIRKKRKNEDD
jgi:hypothetical protein